MKISSKSISVVYKWTLVVAGLLGILVQSGVFSGKLYLSVFNYYTMLSNVLCVVYFSAAALHEARLGTTLLPHVKGAVVMGITVTGLVYHFMLAGSFSMQGTFAISNLILHYVVPIMALLDWLLFDVKGRYTRKSPFLWVLLPNLYFVYVIIRVALGGNLGYRGNRYPYPFINVDALGWGRVLLVVLFLNVLFLLLGYGFVAADRWLGRSTTQKYL